MKCCIHCLCCPILCPLNMLCKAVGVCQDRVFVEVNWREQPYTTKTLIAQGCCGRDERPLWKEKRFVLGVTQEDFDNDRSLWLSIHTPVHANISKGPIADGTQQVSIPISQLVKKNQSTPEIIAMDGDRGGYRYIKWHWQWYSTDPNGKPDYAHPIQK